MTRPMRCRRVFFKPDVTLFKPAGIHLRDLETITLRSDELESIRLLELENLNQEEAASKMQVSQPTFNRIIKGTRKKIADALVNGKAIELEK